MGDVVVDKDISLKWKMPEKPECFFGREMELKTLEQYFAKDNQTVFIQGIAGIGKSELAAMYAIEHRADYDVIVFANCVSDIRTMIASDVEFPLENMMRNTYDEYFIETEDEYSVAGRVMAIRNSGMFIDLMDVTVKIQIFSHK